MKKIFLTSLILLITCAVQAQLGVKAGFNLSNVVGEDFDNPKARASFNAGLILELPLSDNLSIQPELFYSGQGFSVSDESTFGDVDYRINYIQIPVLLKVYLVEGFNIQGGPQWGYKINDNIDFDENTEFGEFELDAVKDSDIQFTIGAELKPGDTFFINARYTYGFSELIDNVRAYNAVLSASLGFMF